MFYNTGIATYIWIVTNRKRKERRGKVQLINATDLFVKMRKSLGNKRNELSNDEHRRDRPVVRRRDQERPLQALRQLGLRLPPDHRRAPAAAAFQVTPERIARSEGRSGVSEARHVEEEGQGRPAGDRGRTGSSAADCRNARRYGRAAEVDMNRPTFEERLAKAVRATPASSSPRRYRRRS